MHIPLYGNNLLVLLLQRTLAPARVPSEMPACRFGIGTALFDFLPIEALILIS